MISSRPLYNNNLICFIFVFLIVELSSPIFLINSSIIFDNSGGIFSFSSKSKVESFKSYLLTKTVRFLLLQAVISQDVTKQNFLFVPDTADYEKLWTDDDLVKKWNITKDEWQYIDSRISNYGK